MNNTDNFLEWLEKQDYISSNNAKLPPDDPWLQRLRRHGAQPDDKPVADKYERAVRTCFELHKLGALATVCTFPLIGCSCKKACHRVDLLGQAEKTPKELAQWMIDEDDQPRFKKPTVDIVLHETGIRHDPELCQHCGGGELRFMAKRTHNGEPPPPVDVPLPDGWTCPVVPIHQRTGANMPVCGAAPARAQRMASGRVIVTCIGATPGHRSVLQEEKNA